MGKISNHHEQLKNWQELSVHTNSKIMDAKGPKLLGRVLLFIFIFFAILLFLPFRQTIPGRGTVTALRPEDRPQTVQNQIGGRIERWYVSEGQEVKKGDALIVLEAMKMENILKSPSDGTIKKIAINKGVAVEKNQLLIQF